MSQQWKRKRVLSKGEYLKVQGKLILMQIGNSIFFAAICLTMCIGVVGVMMGVPWALAYGVEKGEWVVPVLAIVSVPLLAGVVYVGGRQWEAINAKCRELDDVIFISHAQAADFPADTLLRASQESVQAQQAVLLRAAMQTEDRYDEQLLRATSAVK